MGDSIRTGADGRAALLLVDESVVRMNKDTLFVLQNVATRAGDGAISRAAASPAEQSGRSLLGVIKGELWFLNKNPDEKVDIKTRAMTASLRGTEFDIQVESDGTPTVDVKGTTTVSASATSTLPVAFTSTTPAVCTVSGRTVTVVAAGTCTIAANQTGNAIYNAAPQVTQDIAIAKVSQTIGTIGFTPPTVAVKGTTTVSASATSTLPVAFTSTTPAVCTVNGRTVTGVTAGTCTIAANQDGNADYNAALQVMQDIAIGGADQTISAIGFTPPTVAVNGTTTAGATATSGLGVVFTSTTPAVCTVSGSTVTGVTADTCTIAANQAGNANYNAAAQVTQTIAIAKADQSIGTIGFTPSTVAVNGTTSASATATSGLEVVLTSTTPAVCTVSGGTVTGVAAGTCTIAANQDGSADYNAAPQVTREITVDDFTPPAAPTVSGVTPSNDTTPTWTWTSNGGNGTFRYRRNNSNLTIGATVTTATSFTPIKALAQGSHTLYVQERDEAGNWSENGRLTIVIDTTPPDAPQVSGTTPTDNATPTWSWISGGNGGNGAFRYRTNNSNLNDGATFTAATSFTPTTPLAQGTQTLYVQEQDEAGNWSESGGFAIVIDPSLSPPAAPTNLAAAYHSPLSLSWSDVADNEAGYAIYRKLDTETDFTRIGDTGPDQEWYVDGTVVANATYSYYVAAYNGAGESASLPISITIRDIHAPDQVVATVVNAGRKVNLSWRDNSESEDNTVVWRIKEGESGWTKVATLGPDTVAYGNTGLKPRLMYTYTVCATDLVGANECSDKVTVNGPTQIKAVQGATGVDLTWQDNADDETGFRVYRRKSTEVVATQIGEDLGPGAVAYTDTTAAEDMTCFYAVEAYTSAGSATTPTEAMISTGRITPPGAFKAVVLPGSTKAKLTWADKSATETGFAVWRQAQDKPEWTLVKSVAANVKTTTDPGLGIGILYNYKVCAVTLAGGSVCSLESSVNNPTVLQALPPAAGGVTLSWRDNSRDESGFIVYRRKGSGAMTAIATLGVGSTSYTDTMATAGTTFFYQVCAYNNTIDSCSVARKVIMP